MKPHIFLCLCVAAAATQAQTRDDTDQALEAILKLGARYDTNLSEAADSQYQPESAIWVVSPEIVWNVDNRRVRGISSYSANRYTYEYDDQDDHTEHFLDTDWSVFLNRKNTLEVNAYHNQQQNDRTSINRADPAEKVGDQFTDTAGTLGYKLGADSGPAQIQASVGIQTMRFDNNLDTLSKNREREYDRRSTIATVLFAVAPKTRTLLEVRHYSFDYLPADSDLDNDGTSIYGGVVWEASAKTTGSIRIGRHTKSFDRHENGNFEHEAASWDMALRWKPRSYSSVEIMTSKIPEEGSSRSTLVDVTRNSAKWTHYWSSKVFTEARLRYDIEKYVGKDFDGRKDKTVYGTAGMTYIFNRRVSAEFRHTTKSRSSNSAIEEFDRNISEIYLNFKL